MKRFIGSSALIALVAAVAIPTAALASTPARSTAPATARVTHPSVLFVLRGTLSHYTAPIGVTNGSISITVQSSNFEHAALKGSTLTFALDSKSKVVLHDGKLIVNGDRGTVKVRSTKHATPVVLQTRIATQAIDRAVGK